MSNATIYRKDYLPPVFAIESLNLTFDLWDDLALVTNTMALTRQTQGVLTLFGDELELVSIQLDGQDLNQTAYVLQAGNLLLKNLPDVCTLTVTTRIYPQNNTKLAGLYRSHELFCTQCESQGFRRITFFPDHPDVLTLFTTRIIANKAQYPVLLSNGNLVDHGDLADGRHWVLWRDPFKKPSYLFALVAGNLSCVADQFVTQSGRTIALEIYVEPGNEAKCNHAMESLKHAMRWDEQMYGREYDLDIFMIVAVSDFNMGAMENKGLNIFNSKYILACPESATDQDYANIEGVVGHEYFHNWTGNRITCRDWFQLSLKEGLTVFRDQEFSRDMNSRDVNRIVDVKTLRARQFPEDAGSMAHPVRPESYQEINNFYTATIYEKGAEVIRMQETLLGKEGFRRGMDLYFQRHDGHAVTIDDFVAAMEDANQVDFSQFKRWYSQAGTPEVRVSRQFENQQLQLTFTQSCRPTAECHHKQPYYMPIKMALFDRQGQVLQESVLHFKEATQTFTFDNLQDMPQISLFREFSAPIKLIQPFNPEEALFLLRYESDGFSKWNAGQTYVLSLLTQWYQQSPQTWQIPPDFIQVLRHILQDESLDPALRAELMLPPGFEEVVAHLTDVDVPKLEAVRDAYRQLLGQQLYPALESLYQPLWQQEDHGMYGRAYARRRLRNVCLYFMMHADEARSLSVCQQQFHEAKLMTDQFASFSLLVNATEEKARSEAIDAFYQDWKNDELVLDKWFSEQAMCRLPGTLQRVQTLLSHPDFQLKNPNKVRSLIGAFCMSNPRNFHAEDGSGYVFLTEILLAIDSINPQVSSRLALPFTMAQFLNKAQRSKIKQSLDYLASHSLSRDLHELVSKTLAAHTS